MLLSKLLRSYQKLAHNKPYVVQSIQTASLMTAGDIISQSCIEQKSYVQMNYYRVIKFGSIGLVLGPVIMKWYSVIDKTIKSSTKIASLKKVAMDQFLFAPVVVAVLTTVVSLLDGKNVSEIKIKLENDYACILLSNYKVWPFVQYINFNYVPLDYRVLVVQCVAVGWNTYLSWKLNSEKKDQVEVLS